MVNRLGCQEEMRLLPDFSLTFKQFLAWVDEDTYAEWVNGAIIVKGTESAAHQDLLGFLICLLGWFAEDHDAGQISSNPFLMKLPYSGRAPDLLMPTHDGQTFLSWTAKGGISGRRRTRTASTKAQFCWGSGLA